VDVWKRELVEQFKYLLMTEDGTILVTELLKELSLTGVDVEEIVEMMYSKVNDGRYSLFSEEYVVELGEERF